MMYILVETVMLPRIYIPSYQDRYDKRIYCDDSGHDHRDQCLVAVRMSETDHKHCSVLLHTFMMRSGRNMPTPAIPIPDLAVPYAAPAPVDFRLS